MAWIKMRTDLHENPHVIRLATLLAIPRLHVLGLVCRFWAWADTNTPDGRDCLEELHADDLDRIVEHPGFTSAMESVGWLIVTETGIEIPEFDNHMSESAKKRAVNARRMAVSRTVCEKKRTPRAQKTHQRREEKSRGEKKKNTNTESESVAIYDAYVKGKHVGRALALKAIRAALTKIRYAELLEAVQAFAAAKVGADLKYVPNPATWMNQERWNDDRSEWTRWKQSGRPRDLSRPDIPEGKYAGR